MGCGGCGVSTANGKPAGCQSNGNCGTSGCNKMNVFNWLADIPFADFGKPFDIIEVSFNKGSRKDFFRNTNNQMLQKGEWVTVEGTHGFDVGQVSLTGELVKLQMKKYGVKDTPDLKKVLRTSIERDLQVYEQAKSREKDIMIRSRSIARQLNLEMKIAEVEVQADAKKVTFFYTADARVDFRELIKIYASEFKAKVEMRQIGARQESGKVGGIGSCGRELCCSTWLSDFKTVNTTAARYQNLSINQAKLSGQCGRLKCCLNYELDTYMDALKMFPERADYLDVETGRAYLQKKDIFRNLMWYSFSGSNKQYPLTVERVEEILQLNATGKKAEALEVAEVKVISRNIEKPIDMGFVNDVGQITLRSLSKSSSKKKKSKSKPSRNAPAPLSKAGQPSSRNAAPKRAQPGGPAKRSGQAPQPAGAGRGSSQPSPQRAGTAKKAPAPGSRRRPEEGAPRPRPKGRNKPDQQGS